MITAASILLSSIPLTMMVPQTPPSKDSATPRTAVQGAPKVEPPSLTELTAMVAKAHGSSPTKTKVTAYQAEIVIKPQGKGQDSIDIPLKVLYGDAIERAKGKTMPMMRYGTNESGQNILRGDSHDGIWHKIGNEKSISLTDRSHQTDKELIRNHRRLCKIMLRFLDPSAILGSLKQATKVQTVKLRVKRGRRGEIDSYLVSGSLSGFPVARSKQTIKDEVVWVEIWVDKKTSQLRAVRVFPMTPTGKPQWEKGEHILLDKITKVGDIAIPLDLRFFEVKDHNRTNAKLQIQLQKISLNPRLTKQDFAKPK